MQFNLKNTTMYQEQDNLNANENLKNGQDYDPYLSYSRAS